MVKYLTGDLLQSDADALVNTVNCEGFMGKGIAYQFKLKFPKNNDSYVRECKTGNLSPGKLHYFFEQGKLIINFPTKDKWRCKSKMEYINNGLDALIELIKKEKIKSIAIPPLGSGNGGLNWADVKFLMQKKFSKIDDSVDIYIYEPSKYYSSKPSKEPHLPNSALILIEVKSHLSKKTKFRLQKAVYFLNLFSAKNNFSFQANKFGPYSHSIDVISKKIKEFSDFHQTDSLAETKALVSGKLISKSVENNMLFLRQYIASACCLVNEVDDYTLEGISTICFILQKNKGSNLSQIVDKFKDWSPEKSKKFSEDDIRFLTKWLYERNLLNKSLIGYDLNFEGNSYN